MSLNNIIELKNICKKYDRTILDDVNICIQKGDFIVFLGESGAGKSTFLNIIGLLDLEYHGQYYYDGIRIDSSNITNIRKTHLGFIFQLYYLTTSLSIRENIMLPFCFQDLKDEEKIENRYNELLCRLKLNKIINQKINSLSGGEKQRVAIARALIHNPDVIICDEPTGNLDKRNAMEVMNILLEENKNGKTILIVTHDNEIARYANKVYVIDNGGLHEKNIQAD